MVSYADIDAYIAALTPEVAPVVQRIRSEIHQVVPGAGEAIKYQMPTITLDGRSLVHFAAWKTHIGLYPLPADDGPLAPELAPYSTGRGTASFPYATPIPYDLIARVAARLVAERG